MIFAALQGLGVADKLKINIEPGLFEWMAWYQDEMPSWMTAQVGDESDVSINISIYK